MLKISCYKTSQDFLTKAFCLLAEKCYASHLRTAVVAAESEVTVLDGLLWTYSRKNFIPHATEHDILPDKQPIFITSTIKNYADFPVIMLFNPMQSRILEVLATNKLHSSLQKILIIYSDDNDMSYTEIVHIITTSHLKDYEIECFTQTPQGWQKIS